MEFKQELREEILSLLEGIDSGYMDPQELLARTLAAPQLREHIVDVAFEISYPISLENARILPED